MHRVNFEKETNWDLVNSFLTLIWEKTVNRSYYFPRKDEAVNWEQRSRLRNEYEHIERLFSEYRDELLKRLGNS